MKEFGIGVFLALLVFIGIQLSPSSCSRVLPTSTAKIDTLLVERHDTIVKIDSVLRTRTRYIDTSKVSVVHDTLNKMIPDTTHDTVIISSNQLRECVKCEDSLKACKAINSIDSNVIDSLAKIGKEKAPISGGLIHDLKVFGSGVLVGAGIRSFW